MEQIRIFIASPDDAQSERDDAQKIISELSDSGSIGCELISKSWKLEVPPGLVEPVQSYIDRNVRPDEHHIVLVIFRNRIGTALAPGEPTGTEHELAAALESRYRRGHPWTMVYFDGTPFMPKTDEERVQYNAVLELKFKLKKQIDFREYNGTDNFRSMFQKHLPLAVSEYRRTIGSFFDKRRYDDSIMTGENYDCLRVLPGGDQSHYSSFSPMPGDVPFRRARISTTHGYVPNQTADAAARKRKGSYERKGHKIYIVRDPIRPFEIQIGEYRARRYGREPKEVPFEGVPSLSELKASYPAMMLTSQHRWLRMVLAELLNDPEALNYVHEAESEAEKPDNQILAVIARNPSASDELRQQECRFCSDDFQGARSLPESSAETIIIRNDFPYGPFFHYVVFPRESVHAWDAIKIEHLIGMNQLVHEVLTNEFEPHHKTIKGAAGLRMGFNSSIRHLVLGRRTRSSAGASIAHVHKQLWGMASGSVNLADQLRSLCLAFDASGQDYLKGYLEALEKANLIIWSDDYVALYVPFGQIALHEMQVMIKRPTRTFLDLNPNELESLSKAEYVVSRLYGRLDINSFNEIMLSLPFGDECSKSFRLIFTFITREVDLAVSELSLLYVVDQHPCDTMLEVARVWPSRAFKDLDSIPL